MSDPVPEADPPRLASAPKRRRGRWIGVLKITFAVALLGWVAQRLPWTDSLQWFEGASELSVPGEIEGGWRADQVRFRVDPTAVLTPGWPEEARRAQSAGEAVPVTRRSAEEAEAEVSGYEWRPGMPRVFADLRGQGLLTALVALMIGVCFGVTRWWRLLALARCPSSWWNTLRLTYLGLFFNLVMPGLTGGDLAKAVLVVREHPERRAAALATVVIDRLVGLWTLIAMATTVLWVGGDDFQPLRLPMAGVLVAATLGMIFLLVPGPRRALRLDRLLDRLPQAERLRKLEQAALVYQASPIDLPFAILLSVGNHLGVIGAIYAIGHAFGDQLDFAAYVGITPVANIITALPISPGGWGVGEAAFGQLFAMMGSETAMGVAISVTYRLCNAALGLLGGMFLLLPGGAEMREGVREVEGALAD